MRPLIEEVTDRPAKARRYDRFIVSPVSPPNEIYGKHSHILRTNFHGVALRESLYKSSQKLLNVKL